MKKSILVMKSFVLAGALFFVSCNDDDISCPEAMTGELNTAETAFAGKWALSGMIAEDAIDLTDDSEDNPSEDLFVQYSECDRDLVYNFVSDRNYTYKQGSVAEDCNNKLSLVGTWGLTSENRLMLVANCSSQAVNIEIGESSDEFSYDANLTFKDATGAVKTTKVTFTYTKQAEEVTPE